MRASSAHIAHHAPYHHRAELTRRLRDTTPATIIRTTGTTSSNGAATFTFNTMSADAQLWALGRDPGHELRGVPVIGAGPGHIAYTQPERQTITALSRVEALALLFTVSGASDRAATAPGLPPPLP